MQLKFKVEADPATISVEPESEVPAEFVRSKVQEEFEEGNRDLSEALEQASVQVTLA